MKNVRLVCAGLVAMLLVSSCGMMNDGFSGSSIKKRKYTSGFYLSKNKKYKGADSEKTADKIKEDKDAATTDEKQESVTPIDVVTLPEGTVIAIPTQKQTDPAPAQKDEDKAKDGKRKSGTMSSKKNSTPAPVPDKKRKERVPERYLPVKNEAADKNNSHSAGGDADAMFILAVIFAILIPPVGVLIYTNIDWMKVLICLLLTILFFLPGMIYALLVVFDVI